MFFDFFNKKEKEEEKESQNSKDELLRDIIFSISNANDYINQNIRMLKYTVDLFYKQPVKKKELTNNKEDNEQMYMFSFDSEDQDKMDDMINDFIDHLKKKDPDISIEIIENEDMEEDDE